MIPDDVSEDEMHLLSSADRLFGNLVLECEFVEQSDLQRCVRPINVDIAQGRELCPKVCPRGELGRIG